MAMKIEKYVVILVSQNGDKTHLKMSVNRGDKTAEIRLAEASQTDNSVLYVFGNEITKQALKQAKYDYKVSVCANSDINLLLVVGGKAYAGGTGRTPKIKSLMELAEEYEAREKSHEIEAKIEAENELMKKPMEGKIQSEKLAENQQQSSGQNEQIFEQENEEKEKENFQDSFLKNSTKLSCVEGLNAGDNLLNFEEENTSLSWAEKAEKIMAQAEGEKAKNQAFAEEKQEESKVFAFDNIRFDGSNFYLSVKPQLDEIFVCYPEEDTLNNLVPNSRWVRINTSDGYYVVGLVLDGDSVSYICYGVPSTDRCAPPQEIADFAVWLSLGGNDGRGYWLIYQDALTGKCLK